MTPQERKVMELALKALKVAEHFVEEYAASKYYYAHVVAIAAAEEALSSPNGEAQPEQEPCPDKERDEYTCKNRHQCWEPCGELGKSEEHTQPKEPEQEPVAITTGAYGGRFTYVTNKPHVILPDGMGLYASPQRTWVGLDPEEIRKTNHHMVDGAYHYSFKQGAEWAEAKLKERNT